MGKQRIDVLEELQAQVAADLEEGRAPGGGPPYQIIPAAVAMVLGLGGGALAYSYGLGSLREPGPGLWPFAVSVIIASFAAVLLLTGRGLTDSEKLTRASTLPIVGALTFVAMGVLIPLVGFEIPALVFCVIWLRFFGGESWRSTVAVSLAAVVTFYFLFLYGLRVPLPHLF